MKKEEQIRKILQEWVDKQGHDRCWYYPELFLEICKILEITPSKEPKLPPEEEFKLGCDKYRGEQYRN